MHPDNRKRIANMNKILTIGIEKSHLKIANLTELNALHYAAATTLAGVRVINNTPSNPNYNPDKYIDESINKVRKWIGRLTAAKSNIKLTPKVVKYLKGKKVDIVIHRLKMKLAALCRKKRTKTTTRARFQNNKLY